MVERGHDHQTEFSQLVAERRWLLAAQTAAGGESATSVVLPALDSPADSPLTGTVHSQVIVKRLQKLNSILHHGQALAATFAERQVQLTPDLPVPDNGRLDLFVRFPLLPQKAVFAIAFRSQGQSRVTYHEQKGAFYVRNRSGGLKPWQIDLFRRFALQEYWLRKQRPDLFGTSSRDKNRSAVKLLVLTGETRLGQHGDHLYTTVGEQNVLSVCNRVSLFVLREDQLIPFIQAWFTPRAALPTPQPNAGGRGSGT